jgi:thiamine pyrophosphate-dependent acetolactate synthase large subunit-like protein
MAGLNRTPCYVALLTNKELNFRRYSMGYTRKDVENTKKRAKKFVRYQEGAELYSIGLTKFQALAREAKATYKIDKVVLVNCEIFEQFLDTFREY